LDLAQRAVGDQSQTISGSLASTGDEVAQRLHPSLSEKV
ncbi:hypothetical protein A2U01_0099177, partial [Trifolium medium]|nr:hypothetical protein [Trifolium medium]